MIFILIERRDKLHLIKKVKIFDLQMLWIAILIKIQLKSRKYV